MATVQTHNGELRGTEERGLHVFRGVPYARAPVGPLRYQPPQPLDAWDGVRDATQFGAAPVQDSKAMGPLMDLGIGRTDEDCLYLNIWTPGLDDGQRPVMVWIHGGAFILGAGSQSIYDGKTLAKRGDVVVVTINYRLGALGFLPLRDTRGKTLASGNEGILDQIAALQWVQREIAAFGGDPTCVTIFGESAGAMSCATLLGAPAAKGLFQRAILQSGSANYISSPQAAQAMAEAYLRELGLHPPEAGQLQDKPASELLRAQRRFLLSVLLDPNETLSGNFLTPRRLGPALFTAVVGAVRFVRRLLRFVGGSARDLVQPGRRVGLRARLRALRAPLFARTPGAELPFEPVAGGDLLPRYPFEAVADGQCAGVDLLIGTNLDEQKLFSFMDPRARFLNEKSLLQRFRGKFRHRGAAAGKLADEALQAYREARQGRGDSITATELWYAFENDRTMRWPAMHLAELQSAHRKQTWAYLFTWRSPFMGGRLGACHALELPFVFGTLDQPALKAFAGSARPGAHELAEQMQDAWIRFARTGNPGGAGLPEWLPYEPGQRHTMEFGRECQLLQAPYEAERAFWDRIR